MKISDKYTFYDKKDIEIVTEIIKSKKLSGTSNFVLEYEQKLASFFESKHAVAVSSGTAAIQVALYALGVKAGDEVIISSACPLMSVVPIMELKVKPVFCDTNENDFGLNLNDLKKLISPKVKAVIEVPMWGYPTNVIDLNKYLKRNNIPLLLDLAQAHGTQINNKHLSNYGDISCFSTHDRKILATGEGGFCLTDKKNLYNKMQSYIKFGGMNGIEYGLNFKLAALQAGVGINRINFISKQLKKRSENAHYLLNKINNEKISEFKIIKKGLPNYYTLILTTNNYNAKHFMDYLDRYGIPSDIKRYNFKVLYKYPLFKKYLRKCKNSEKLSQNITTIPVHPGIKKKELNYMANIINNYNINE
ncbi:MAG: aminotransferase class V-fold PLP-dependent enzyme [Parcubacteria group bacterium]